MRNAVRRHARAPRSKPRGRTCGRPGGRSAAVPASPSVRSIDVTERSRCSTGQFFTLNRRRKTLKAVSSPLLTCACLNTKPNCVHQTCSCQRNTGPILQRPNAALNLSSRNRRGRAKGVTWEEAACPTIRIRSAASSRPLTRVSTGFSVSTRTTAPTTVGAGMTPCSADSLGHRSSSNSKHWSGAKTRTLSASAEALRSAAWYRSHHGDRAVKVLVTGAGALLGQGIIRCLLETRCPPR